MKSSKITYYIKFALPIGIISTLINLLFTTNFPKIDYLEFVGTIIISLFILYFVVFKIVYMSINPEGNIIIRNYFRRLKIAPTNIESIAGKFFLSQLLVKITLEKKLNIFGKPIYIIPPLNLSGLLGFRDHEIKLELIKLCENAEDINKNAAI